MLEAFFWRGVEVLNMREERSLADTPIWSVATKTTVFVAVCFLVQRSIYRFGKVWECTCIWAFDRCFRLGCLDGDFLVTIFQWLRMTSRKALLASLEKIKEGVYFVSSLGSSFQPRNQLIRISSKVLTGFYLVLKSLCCWGLYL